MSNREPRFNDEYRKHSNYFGDEPEKILIENLQLINKERPALDIGAGQGRNALYLARNGIEVDAIDPSEEAVKELSRAALSAGLPLKAIESSFETFDPDGSYGAICLFGLIPLLAWPDIKRLQQRVESWSVSETIIFVTGFTTQDPNFETFKKKWRSIGKNCFENVQGNVRTFLEPGEAVRLFAGVDVLHHWEGMGPEHRHGDGPLQKHALVELVVRKTK